MNTHRLYTLAFCLLLTSFVTLAPVYALYAAEAPASATSVKELTAKEAAALIAKPPKEGLNIIDVRTPAEFASGHIEGAKNLDYFGEHLEKLLLQQNRQMPTLLYCGSGKRSAGALDMMQQMGFTRIYHLTDGIRDWTNAGQPVVKGKK